jgi:nitroreductase
MFGETFEEAWQKRFGSEAGFSLDEIGSLLTHRSVRRFKDEEIPDSMVQGLVAAAQSAATSSNLQTWSVISVKDPTRRAAVAEACGSQKQVLTAPLFFAFLADLHRTAEYAGEVPSGLDTIEMYTVAIIDAALAAERMVCAAESLGFGICYIGGLRNQPDTIKQLLQLPSHVAPVFGLCIGTPAESAHAEIKPRLRQDQVWFEEVYGAELDPAEYDARAAEFFGSQGMATDMPWSLKNAVRTRDEGLSGRERLSDFLHSQGLAKR